jgi:hypothetical protein
MKMSSIVNLDKCAAFALLLLVPGLVVFVNVGLDGLPSPHRCLARDEYLYHERTRQWSGFASSVLR